MDLSELTDYNEGVQELFLRFLVSDANLLSRCINIVDPQFFNSQFRAAVELLQTHSEQYNAVPTLDQVNAIGKLNIELMTDITPEHQNWFLDEFETFCRHKGLERALLNSADLLGSQQYGKVEENIKAALQIGLVKDFGLSYFEDPKTRLQWLLDQKGAVSTGWKDVDQKLYGGFNRGELSIFAGPPGAGKSLFLQNLGLNWALDGLSGVLFSFELSEKLIGMRLDSMVSGFGTREVLRNIDAVDTKVRYAGKNAGELMVKYLPSGSTTNDLRAYVREYEIQTGKKIDFILADYLDLMAPNGEKISAENMFVKDKYVSEQLRNFAMENDVLFVTASQLNRAAVEEVEFDNSHIAGGISKVNTADNVIGIFTSNAMKQNGRYQIQFMKTRSSSGVGSKVDLIFDQNTLRILDLPDGEEGSTVSTTRSLMNSLQANQSVDVEPTEEVGNPADLINFIRNRQKTTKPTTGDAE